MKRLNTTKLTLISLGSILMVGVLSLTTYISYALFTASKDDNGEYTGNVGLRSYFQKGTGTEADPFVISRPIHFYNLTRLQNLGVFGSKYYFSLGYDPDNPTDRKTLANLKFYPDDSTEETSQMISYLDMSVDSSLTMTQIGTEGSPFYGVFDGKGKDIYGLTIHGGPEDVGVFGYTYSGSMVKDVGFSNLTVEDDGYQNNIAGLDTSQAMVNDVLGSLYSTSDAGSLTLVYSGGTSPVTTSEASQDDVYDSSTKNWNISFKATCPSIAIKGITYRFRSASEYFSSDPNNSSPIEVSSTTGGSELTLYPNNGDSDETNGRYTLQSNTSFKAGSIFNSRFSIIADYYYAGYSYSKVLSTYLISITKVSDAKLNISLWKDSTATDGTSYAHGTNIGFLIGHCDGSASGCYVFGGAFTKADSSVDNGTSRLVINGGGSTYQKLAQETDTGLIGEYGSAIDTEYTPQSQYDTAGDTGVINFTKMYSDIVGTSTFNATSDGGTSFYTYTPVDEDTTTSDLDNKYKDFLLNNGKLGTSFSYVSKSENTVDFQGYSYLQENSEKTRGLGVFGLATSPKLTNTSSNFTNGLGDLTLSKNGTSFDTFYYTTAEYHDTTSGVNAGSDNVSVRGWSMSNTSDPKLRLATAYYLPTYTSSSYWDEKLESTFDFIIKCPLSINSQFYSKNFFANSTNSFLQDYLTYKFCDKYGKPLTTGSTKSGVFVKNVDPSNNLTTSISSFDSALNMVGYGNSAITTDDFDTYTQDTDGNEIKVNAPAKSINFSIASDYANVTVMATNSSSSESFVGIYDKSKTLTTSYNTNNKRPGRNPLYAMHLPKKSSTNDDVGYFNYEWNKEENNTDSFATRLDMSSTYLFAHTFKLPKGSYFIGTPSDSVSIYYVCVQGQEGQGNTGNVANLYSKLNSITNIEFTTKQLSDTSFDSSIDSLNMSFKAKLNAVSGSITYGGVGSGDARSFALSKDTTALSYMAIYNPKIWAFSFGSDSYLKGERASLIYETSQEKQYENKITN